MIHVSTTITDLVTGFFLPVIINIITKSTATSFQKRLVLAICSAVAAVVSTVATNAGNIVGVAGWTNLLIVAAMAVASYYGWWKGGTAFEALRVKTANFGFGSRATTPATKSDAGYASIAMSLMMSTYVLAGMLLLAMVEAIRHLF